MVSWICWRRLAIVDEVGKEPREKWSLLELLGVLSVVVRVPGGTFTVREIVVGGSGVGMVVDG